MAANKIHDFKIEKKTLEHNAKLKQLLTAMKAHDIDGAKYLPDAEYETCGFRLANSYSGFANAIRRVLMSEIPTRCLHVTQYISLEESKMPSAIYTDDEFIRGTTDVVIKNINSIPITQDIDFSKYSFYLYVVNQTHNVINVRASDIRSRLPTSKNKIVTGGKPNNIKKIVEADSVPSHFTVPQEIIYDEKNAIDIRALIPNPNITIARLRPGKTIFISDFLFETGISLFDAAKFTLLDSIIYRVNVKHYADGGPRSIAQSVNDFYLEFTTAGNISAVSVLNKAVEVLQNYMTSIKKTIEPLNISGQLFYANDEVSVSCVSHLYTYKFQKHYFTSMNLLAQQCMRLDPSTVFCAANVESYDTRNASRDDIRVGVLKLKHLEPNKLIIAAADAVIAELNAFKKTF